MPQVHLLFLKFHTKTVGQRKPEKLHQKVPETLWSLIPVPRCAVCPAPPGTSLIVGLQRDALGIEKRGDKEPAALGDKRMDISRQMVRYS